MFGKRGLRFWYHKSFAIWIRHTDIIHKQFFQPHRIKTHKHQLTSMRCFDESVTSDVIEMRDTTSSFYRNVLIAIPFLRNNLIKRDYVWSSVSNRVSSQMQVALLAPLQPLEVLFSTKALDKDVCLGIDGMGVSWYIEYWDMIGKILTSAY